ncbi:MAG: hypothetical protein Q7U88_01905 [Desulfocapsaceae bacterium]|nr:hypothetical protein [Desulfocapsaceae bacterium]
MSLGFKRRLIAKRCAWPLNSTVAEAAVLDDCHCAAPGAQDGEKIAYPGRDCKYHLR